MGGHGFFFFFKNVFLLLPSTARGVCLFLLLAPPPAARPRTAINHIANHPYTVIILFTYRYTYGYDIIIGMGVYNIILVPRVYYIRICVRVTRTYVRFLSSRVVVVVVVLSRRRRRGRRRRISITRRILLFFFRFRVSSDRTAYKKNIELYYRPYEIMYILKRYLSLRS